MSPPEPSEEPVFAEPWQARAFALVRKLAERGHFTSSEWTAALAREVAGDDGSHYYEHWLAALEKLVVDKGLADSAALLARKEAWHDAYLHTPHGQPVELWSRGTGAAVAVTSPAGSGDVPSGDPSRKS